MGCEMAKLKNIDIILDNAAAIYKPGDNIIGHVLVEVTEEVTVADGKLWFYGKAETVWKEVDKDLRENIRNGHQSFIQTCIPIIACDGRQKTTDVNISAGIHKYAFQFQLPDNIPSSFELSGANRARVFYSLRANIESQDRSVSHSREKGFIVLRVLDLNSLSRLKDRVHLRKDFDLSCCCFSKGQICCDLSVNKIGFVPGETLNIDVDIRNQSATAIQSTNIQFEQIVDLHGGSFTTRSSSIVFGITGHRIKPGGTGLYHDVVHLPPLPPSGLEGCDIIHIDYVIQVNIHIGGFFAQNKPMEMTLPIMIGTVPLRDAFCNFAHVVPCHASFDFQTGDIEEYKPDSITRDDEYIRPVYLYYKTNQMFLTPAAALVGPDETTSANRSSQRRHPTNSDSLSPTLSQQAKPNPHAPPPSRTARAICSPEPNGTAVTAV